MANVKVEYEVFKLLDNGQIDNNCCKSFSFIAIFAFFWKKNP